MHNFVGGDHQCAKQTPKNMIQLRHCMLFAVLILDVNNRKFVHIFISKRKKILAHTIIKFFKCQFMFVHNRFTIDRFGSIQFQMVSNFTLLRYDLKLYCMFLAVIMIFKHNFGLKVL